MTVAFVLALMLAISPIAPKTNDAQGFAQAIARVVSTATLPEGVSRPMAAALIVQYAWDEGRFSLRASRGDHGAARCALQVHTGDWAESSPEACVRAGWYVMMASYKLCGDASGFCGSCRLVAGEYASRFAVAISDRRVYKAQGLLDAVVMRAERER